MRKLPKAKYGKSEYLDRIDADGVFDTCQKTIEIRHGMDWNEEMRVIMHEIIHWIETQYGDKIIRIDDSRDLNKNDADRIAISFCKRLVKPKYKKLFK